MNRDKKCTKNNVGTPAVLIDVPEDAVGEMVPLTLGCGNKFEAQVAELASSRAELNKALGELNSATP